MSRNAIIFILEAKRYALPIQGVERGIRAVEVTPIPRAHDSVLGVINIQGDRVPVLSLRWLLRLPEREIVPEDEFLVVKCRARRMVLVTDSINGVMDPAEQDVREVDRSLPGAEFMEGMIWTPTGLIPILNPDLFLPAAEEKRLQEALESSDVP